MCRVDAVHSLLLFLQWVSVDLASFMQGASSAAVPCHAHMYLLLAQQPGLWCEEWHMCKALQDLYLHVLAADAFAQAVHLVCGQVGSATRDLQ
jgi:hypothetical protein